MQNKADLIFMKWKAELANMDRSWPAVEGNFELLWDQFFRGKIKMDEALQFLDRASKAHHPKDSTVKAMHRKMKPITNDQTVQEYGEQWRSKITNKCREVFFAFYEIDGVEKEKKKMGGMSRAEYVKLQRYADSHETVDWEAIIKERDETEEEPDIDVTGVDVNIDLGGL